MAAPLGIGIEVAFWVLVGAALGALVAPRARYTRMRGAIVGAILGLLSVLLLLPGSTYAPM